MGGTGQNDGRDGWEDAAHGGAEKEGGRVGTLNRRTKIRAFLPVANESADGESVENSALGDTQLYGEEGERGMSCEAQSEKCELGVHMAAVFPREH